MARIIIKIKDRYFDYSTVVEAPVTRGMTLDEFREYYRGEYGEWSLDELEGRLHRVEEKGTSSFLDESVEETIAANYAGDGDSSLTLDEMYDAYFVEERCLQ